MSRFHIRLLLPLLVADLSVFGGEDGRANTAADGAPFVLVADIQQIMHNVLDPAADAYWQSVGWIIDADGEHLFAPESEEEWEEVVDAAFTVAESGNLLLMEGRAVDRGAWTTLSRSMIEAGREAIAAAEARDHEAVFRAGGDLYHACVSCHSMYAVETLRPAANPDPE
jgi:hypothetical protein